MMESNIEQQQVKSKERVKDFGEVFTNPREVKAMLDLVKDESYRVDSRFLEPACGNGNFLIEILARKLQTVNEVANSRQEWELLTLVGLGSIYAIDIQEDNVDESRERLLTHREKLQTLATRIPLFMYLTDFREEKLTDVITKVQPELFEKTTGLTVEDFELLVELGLFNSELMNDVVYKFRNYEESSMSYSGINRHEGETVAGFDTIEDSKLVNKKYCFPNSSHLKESKVYRIGNEYILMRNSLIERTDGLQRTEKDFKFDSLNEAAEFIFGNKNADWTEFNIEFL